MHTGSIDERLGIPARLAIVATCAVFAVPAVMWATPAQARIELSAAQIRIEGWFGILPRRLRLSVPISDLSTFRPTTTGNGGPDSPLAWNVEVGFPGRSLVLYNLQASAREIVALTDAIAERAELATGSALDIPPQLRQLTDHDHQRR